MSLGIDPELITEIALGIKPVEKVFAEYGFSDQQRIDTLRQTWFQREVINRQKELEDEGFTLSSKMKLLAEDLLVDAYKTAKASDSTSAKLEVGKYLARLADIEPKNNAGKDMGPGFSITINVPAVGETPQPKVIEAQRDTGNVLPPVIDLGLSAEADRDVSGADNRDIGGQHSDQGPPGRTGEKVESPDTEESFFDDA